MSVERSIEEWMRRGKRPKMGWDERPIQKRMVGFPEISHRISIAAHTRSPAVYSSYVLAKYDQQSGLPPSGILRFFTRFDYEPMRFVIAFRAFFAVLFNKKKALEVQSLLHRLRDKPALPEKASDANPSERKSDADRGKQAGGENQGAKEIATSLSTAPKTQSTSKSNRSDALTLLSTLQREARFIDLVQESLDPYSDAQIGAAARDVLRDTKKSLERVFGLQSLVQAAEGDQVSIPDSPSPLRWKLIGSPNASGVLVHPGWVATKVELPTWAGKSEDQWVVAAAEVET